MTIWTLDLGNAFLKHKDVAARLMISQVVNQKRITKSIQNPTEQTLDNPTKQECVPLSFLIGNLYRHCNSHASFAKNYVWQSIDS